MIFVKTFFIFVVFTFSFLFAENASDLFLVNQIEKSLVQRNVFFNSVGISADGLRINSWDPSRKDVVMSRIDHYENALNPWYNFFKGMLAMPANNSVADSFFQTSIKLTQSEPGTTWLLFNEFNRYRISKWPDSCLIQLEHQIYDAGANSSIVLSTLLKNCGYNYEKQGNYQTAIQMYNWAERFDPDQTWTVLRKMIIAWPSNLNELQPAFKEYFAILNQSWVAQLNLADSLYFFIRAIFFILMIAIFAVVMIKHFPAALHTIADLYPKAISVTLRTILASIVFISLSFFSIYFLLWLSAFVMWKFLNHREKLILSFALFILILTPIDAFITKTIDTSKDPDKVLSVYKSTLREGYNEGIYKKLLSAPDRERIPLKDLSISLCAYKAGDLNTAQLFAKQALDITPNDPVALVQMGNVLFQKDSFSRAKHYFDVAASENERDISPLFNQAQCYLRQTETVKATALMDRAAKENSIAVNSFIEKNDNYYSKNWPPLRYLMIPEYTPVYFWKNIFFKFDEGWTSANSRWGTSFFGLNPFHSFLLFVVLFIMLLISPIVNSVRKGKIFFECRYCGRIICKKCSESNLCKSCYESTEYVKNDKKLEQLRFRILKKFKLIQGIRDASLDILFPGCGSALSTKKSIYASTLIMSFTSIIYVLIYNLVHYYYNAGKNIEILLFIAVLLVYNLFFLIKKISEISLLFKSNSRNQI